VRPSGTEPKVKIYIDASSAEGTVAERRSRARAAVDRLAAGVAEFVY
jgi:phosphomannomutase